MRSCGYGRTTGLGCTAGCRNDQILILRAPHALQPCWGCPSHFSRKHAKQIVGVPVSRYAQLRQPPNPAGRGFSFDRSNVTRTAARVSAVRLKCARPRRNAIGHDVVDQLDLDRAAPNVVLRPGVRRDERLNDKHEFAVLDGEPCLLSTPEVAEAFITTVPCPSPDVTMLRRESCTWRAARPARIAIPQRQSRPCDLQARDSPAGTR